MIQFDEINDKKYKNPQRKMFIWNKKIAERKNFKHFILFLPFPYN